MTNPCCCLPPLDRCEARDAVRADILTMLPAQFTADLSGSANMYSRTGPFEQEYISCQLDPNLGYICADVDCCRACHPFNDCQTFNCYQTEHLLRRACTNELKPLSTNRVFSSNVSTAECACLGSPASCTSCTGFTGCSFINNGFNAYTGPFPTTCFGVYGPSCPTLTAPQCPCPLCGTFNIAQNIVITTVGTTTTTSNKVLRMFVWNTYEKGVCVCRLALRLYFNLSGSTTFSAGCFSAGATDSFTQSAVWHLEWNGTDTLAQFLAKPLNLMCSSWDYVLCPFHNGSPSDTFRCQYMDSFTDSTCNEGECDPCTQAAINIVTTDFAATFGGGSLSCAAPMSSGIVDSNYQPWQGPPTTILVA